METIHDFDENPIDVEGFQIEDDASAAWAMRKLLHAEQERQKNVEVGEAEHQRIDAWLERVNSKFNRDIEFFEGLLRVYAVKQRAEGRKTIDTPYGSVKSRQTQAKFQVHDVDQFLSWADKNCPDAITVKVSPSVSALKGLVSVEHTDTLGWVAMMDTGEIVPGVSVEPADVSYTVEVSK